MFSSGRLPRPEMGKTPGTRTLDEGGDLNPLLKKVVAGVAATKAIDKIQELRRPKQSFVRRNFGKLLFAGIAGGALAWFYKSGKAENLIGGGAGSGSYRNDYPTGPGTEPIPAPERRDSLEPAGV